MNLAYLNIQIKAIDEALAALNKVPSIITEELYYQYGQANIEAAISELKMARPRLATVMLRYDEQVN
jgi:hypothetical protein